MKLPFNKTDCAQQSKIRKLHASAWHLSNEGLLFQPDHIEEHCYHHQNILFRFVCADFCDERTCLP